MPRPTPYEPRRRPPSRWTFLKGVLAAGIVGPIALKTPEARAQRITVYDDEWYKALPPGIGRCIMRRILAAFPQTFDYSEQWGVL